MRMVSFLRYVPFITTVWMSVRLLSSEGGGTPSNTAYAIVLMDVTWKAAKTVAKVPAPGEGPASSTFMSFVALPFVWTARSFPARGITFVAMFGLFMRLLVARTHRQRKRVLLVTEQPREKVDGVARFSHEATKDLPGDFELFMLTSDLKGERPPGLAGYMQGFCISTPPHVSLEHRMIIPGPITLFWTFFVVAPDAVLCMQGSIPAAVIATLCRVFRIPVVLTEHTKPEAPIRLAFPDITEEDVSGLVRVIEEYLFHLPALVLTPLRGEALRLVERWPALAGRAFFLPSGVDTDLFRPPAIPRPYIPHDDETPKILYVGRVSHEKSPLDLISIFRLFYQREKKGTLTIVGDGPMMEDLKAFIAYWTVLDGVDYLKMIDLRGTLRGKELVEAYQTADMFFSPSMTDTYPLVYLEAMATGLPVIGPRAGGTADVFTGRGNHGYHYNPGGAEAAVEAIERTCRMLAQRQFMPEEVIRYAEGHTWKKTTSTLSDALKRVMA